MAPPARIPSCFTITTYLLTYRAETLGVDHVFERCDFGIYLLRWKSDDAPRHFTGGDGSAPARFDRGPAADTGPGASGAEGDSYPRRCPAQARSMSPAYRQFLNDAGPAKVAVRMPTGVCCRRSMSAEAWATRVPVPRRSAARRSTRSRLPTRRATASTESPVERHDPDGSRDAEGQPACRGAGHRDRDHHALQRCDDPVSHHPAGGGADRSCREQVQRNGEFLALAQARQNVGQATLLDVRQSRDRGESRVDLLVAQQTENEAKLELLGAGRAASAVGHRARAPPTLPGEGAGI